MDPISKKGSLNIGHILDQVNPALLHHLHTYPHKNPKLLEAAVYCVGAKGHRWRPLLFLLLWKELTKQEDLETVMPFACALEYLHTASIILDDLPSMDNGMIRRGRKTCHRQFGEALTILTAFWLGDVSDYLLHKVCEPRGTQVLRYVEEGMRDLRSTLMAGQLDDLNPSPKAEVDIIEMYRKKSGTFYGFVASASARLAGYGNVAENLKKFGESLGIAYQISDDISDQTAGEENLGKDVKKDDLKSTIPMTSGLERAVHLRKQYFEAAVKELGAVPQCGTEFRLLAQEIIFMG